MADIRLKLDEVKLCVKDAQLLLHGVRRDSNGQLVDHIDITLPWSFHQALGRLVNFDGINYQSLNDETA